MWEKKILSLEGRKERCSDELFVYIDIYFYYIWLCARKENLYIYNWKM